MALSRATTVSHDNRFSPLAEGSGVAIDVRTGDLELPEPLHAVAAATGAVSTTWIVAVATLPRSVPSLSW